MKRISAELRLGTAVTITDGRHSWRADEPPDAGGTDTGPTPYELLLGALAACTCVTLALYCRHKSIPLTAVRASFEHDKIHAQDCADCEDKTLGFIDEVRTHVVIVGAFDEAQRRRLTQVAERCPVHKTLVNGVKIRDRVEFAAS
jgi:putative redox protein